MKKTLFLLAMAICCLQAISQSTTDTTTILYNWKNEVIEKGIPSYFGKVWKEGSYWHKQDFFYPSGILKADALYSDAGFKIKNGVYTAYHRNGIMQDSCLFIADKKQGTEASWDTAGNQIFAGHWYNNLPVDTAGWWNDKGKLVAVQMTDSFGNGLYQKFNAETRSLRVRGLLKGGKNTGKWTYKDENGILSMEAVFEADSALSVLCYDEQGQLQTDKKDCTLEKPAAFKRGLEGWRRYLEQSLQYPRDAMAEQITGLVRIQFNIEKDGSVSDVKVLEAPSKSLGEEGLRIIKKGPKWEPAIQYNRPVIYRHIQSITFAM